jgi:hypothetical protein
LSSSKNISTIPFSKTLLLVPYIPLGSKVIPESGKKRLEEFILSTLFQGISEIFLSLG